MTKVFNMGHTRHSRAHREGWANFPIAVSLCKVDGDELGANGVVTTLGRAGLDTKIVRWAGSHSAGREEVHGLSDINHRAIDLGLDPSKCYVSTVSELVDWHVV